VVRRVLCMSAHRLSRLRRQANWLELAQQAAEVGVAGVWLAPTVLRQRPWQRQ